MNTLRQVRRLQDPSYAWIALHRLVEAHARSSGQSYTTVFTDLERRFGFGRQPGQWPPVSVMKAAAEDLAKQREAMLAIRNNLIEATRLRKRKGDRHADPELVNYQRRIAGNGKTHPIVGVWGWRIRRLQGDA